MRYYELILPGREEPEILTNIRSLKGLPEGTRIAAIVTDRDGDLADSWEVPIIDGKPQVSGRGKQSTSYFGLR